ncbi:helix-turn-helix domain-containing protein [Bacillus mycoides]|uniref:Transcriptional regulator, XRE family n=1 Tax=Bacillus mycoides (strain KBAB4) TaxID=315730 RepID=A9VVJ1_BACMK|nr:helix-turn-helix transcriptional regulator [Bacillus mycoides]ABY46806.1 transcriptional regulator, XRE family [Bacillus mycoides KBAB4]
MKNTSTESTAKKAKTAKKKPQKKPQPHAEFMEISQYLRKVRESKGLTLVDASEKIGIGFVFLSEIERALKAPSTIAIQGIARTYGINECEIALAYRKVPISVLDALTEHKEVLNIIYDVTNNEKITQGIREKFYGDVFEIYSNIVISK